MLVMTNKLTKDFLRERVADIEMFISGVVYAARLDFVPISA